MKFYRIKIIFPTLILVIFVFSSFMLANIKKADAADTGTTINFDVLPGQSPKILPGSNQVPIVLKVIMDIGKYGTFCGDPNATSFRWSIAEHVPVAIRLTDVDLVTNTEKFDRTTQTINKTLSTTITAQSDITSGSGLAVTLDPINFYALIECSNMAHVLGVPVGTHSNVAQSTFVPVIVGEGVLNYACAVPTGGGKYAYSCSNGNLSNCSDNPQCASNPPCSQIRVSLCGSPAPAPGTGGGDKYSCNSSNQCVTDTNGTYTNSNCDYKCVSATGDKNYSFNIVNPLVGGPNNVFDIINIVTQWIMYISVPLAVLWIMYAGFLMLTAGPKPENFQKGRDILKYTILGLAIIFIGKGFVSLIISVIELGGTSPAAQTQTLPNAGSTGGGEIGSDCQQASCQNGLKCQNTICQRQGGNNVGETCLGGEDCAQGLSCDYTAGTCFQP